VECDFRVGGRTTGSICPVAYPDTGSYSLLARCTPDGHAPVTATAPVDLEPHQTTTVVSPIQDFDVDPGANQTTTYFAVSSVQADVTDPNGLYIGWGAPSPPVFTFTDADGDTFTFTPPAGQLSCQVDIQETVYTGQQTVGGGPNDLFVSRLISSNCTGGGSLPGIAVPAWAVTTSFPGRPGYAASSSAPIVLTAYRP
jgi:hypothetical protein